MPIATNQGVRIHWETEGDGEPLLMIMGLGYSLHMWREWRHLMARHFRAIVFDNRGVGESSVPWRPTSMAEMARDAASVLDAAGAESAHVIGMSMGGMIAQEFALLFPHRVRSLVLGCTSCGGRNSVRVDPMEMASLLSRLLLPRQARMTSVIPWIYDPHTARDRIEEDLAVLRRNFPRLPGFLAQLGAILTWQSWDRLPRIAAPTLVIHGETDRLVPAANANVLAARIPGARLALLPQAGHIFPTDQPEASKAAVLGFLTSLSSR